MACSAEEGCAVRFHSSRRYPTCTSQERTLRAILSGHFQLDNLGSVQSHLERNASLTILYYTAIVSEEHDARVQGWIQFRGICC